MSHLKEEEMVVDYYGESTGETSRHLSECPHCAETFAGLARFLDRLPIEEAPEPPAEWEDHVWTRLEWRLGQERKRSWRPWLLVAAGLVLAFVAGLLTRDLVTLPEVTGAPEQRADLTSDDEGRNRVFLLVLSDHFERSERVLLELSHDENLPGAGQSRAEELLSRNRLYRLTAEQTGNIQLASLLEELEPILVEIARTPDQDLESAHGSIQRRIEERELIFKIRVLGHQIRQDVKPGTMPDLSL